MRKRLYQTALGNCYGLKLPKLCRRYTEFSSRLNRTPLFSTHMLRSLSKQQRQTTDLVLFFIDILVLLYCAKQCYLVPGAYKTYALVNIVETGMLNI